MAEPLAVDPSRLKDAGTDLRGQVFPVPPPSIVAPGTDPVSAAINETLPILESPVIDGLRDAKAALTYTASNIDTAAGMYADTDQRLGERLSQVQFLAPSDRDADQRPDPKPDQAHDGEMADEPLDGDTPGTPSTLSPPGSASPIDQITPQLGQAAGMTGPVGALGQSVMQGAQGGMGAMPAGGPTSAAQRAGDDPKSKLPTGDQAQSIDESLTPTTDNDEDRLSDTLADGAAPGDQTIRGVPSPPLAPGWPATAPQSSNPIPGRDT